MQNAGVEKGNGGGLACLPALSGKPKPLDQIPSALRPTRLSGRVQARIPPHVRTEPIGIENRRIKTMARITTSILIVALTFGEIMAQSWLPRPEEVLARADSAIRNLRSIAYQAEHFTIGTLKYGDKTALLPPFRGEVKIVRLNDDEAVGAKIAVKGELIRRKPGSRNSTFEIAYDGHRIRKLDKEKQLVYANTPDQTGRTLFLDAQDLILWVFTSEERLEQAFTAESTQYAGLSVIDGVPCHIVYTKSVSESSTTEAWWYFGADDYIPRQVQRKYSGVPGQEHSAVTRLTKLVVNADMDADAFVIEAPGDYQVKEYQGFGKKSAPALAVGDEAPAWVLFDAGGVKHSLDDLRGKIIVMDFWATWCGSCIEAMPHLQKLHERYSDHGVVILGISTWEGGDPAAFMQKRGLTYQLLVEGDSVAKSYHVSGLPTLYVVDRNGKIIYGEVGTKADSYQKLVQVLERHLNEE